MLHYTHPKKEMRMSRSHFYPLLIHKMHLRTNFVNLLSFFDVFCLKVRFIV